jgi:predicted RNase H-like nuclease (RuvC/YqgF family)
MQPQWWVTLLITLVAAVISGGAAWVAIVVKIRRDAEKVRQEFEKAHREADSAIATAAKTSVTAMSSVIAKLHAELDDRTKQVNRLKTRVRELERRLGKC